MRLALHVPGARNYGLSARPQTVRLVAATDRRYSIEQIEGGR
jgi:hypothetical protein